MTAASGFKERFEKPSSTLTYGYDNQRIERVQHNREILKWVIKTIELCAKQSICIRFLDKNNNIREEFSEFGKCEQLNGKVIATEIIRILEKSNLEIKNCRWQRHNDAKNMSSEVQ